MALKEVTGPAGAPWEPRLQGRVVELVVDSELLATNPLGDPSTRPLYVYLPAGAEDLSDLPAIYVIQGFTGQVVTWRNHSPFEPTMFERVDRMFADGCPPAVIVFVDAWTSLGGSQFLDSTATGPYMSYLCDEVVPFIDSRFPTAPNPEKRGVQGKSSGGYGAMVVSMKRPDVFNAFATHAGDALFECCYLRDFPNAARTLRDHFDGSYEVFFEALASADRFEQRFHDPLDLYAMAACYSPNEAEPTRVDLPFDVRTGALIPEVWERWLQWDPVRMVPDHVDALRAMKRIYIDAGKQDEYYLDLGAQAFSDALTAAGIEHSFELFDGRHGGLQYRYPGSLRELIQALT